MARWTFRPAGQSPLKALDPVRPGRCREENEREREEHGRERPHPEGGYGVTGALSTGLGTGREGRRIIRLEVRGNGAAAPASAPADAG